MQIRCIELRGSGVVAAGEAAREGVIQSIIRACGCAFANIGMNGHLELLIVEFYGRIPVKLQNGNIWTAIVRLFFHINTVPVIDIPNLLFVAVVLVGGINHAALGAGPVSTT